MQKKCAGLILLLIIKYVVYLCILIGDNSYLFVNGKEVTKFKAKNSELIKHSMCLGNISFDYYTKSKIKYTGLYGNIHDFSVDYSAITNDKILDIHKYLIEKNDIV